MPDNHYLNPKLADIYDLDSGWSADRDFYLSLAGTPPQRILDFGCGTGLLCDAYAAKGHQVTGVDPAMAMLEAGKRKTHGNNIEWVHSSAQLYKSDKLFDLIIMTGHAFQVLLEDSDIQATFDVMRTHLKDEGSIVFESRNPAINCADGWDYDMDLKVDGGVVRESRRFFAMKNDRMTFGLTYQFPDEELTSFSELRFMNKNDIEERLKSSGLYAHKVLGDWDGTPYDEKSSPEMIFIVRPLL